MSNQPTRFEALNAAVNKLGSQSEFARNLGVSQPTVWRWLNQSKQLPAEYLSIVETLTGVSRYDLRPDICPRPLMLDRAAVNRFHGRDHLAGGVL